MGHLPTKRQCGAVPFSFIIQFNNISSRNFGSWESVDNPSYIKTATSIFLCKKRKYAILLSRKGQHDLRDQTMFANV